MPTAKYNHDKMFTEITIPFWNIKNRYAYQNFWTIISPKFWHTYTELKWEQIMDIISIISVRTWEKFYFDLIV